MMMARSDEGSPPQGGYFEDEMEMGSGGGGYFEDEMEMGGGGPPPGGYFEDEMGMGGPPPGGYFEDEMGMGGGGGGGPPSDRYLYEGFSTDESHSPKKSCCMNIVWIVVIFLILVGIILCTRK